MKIIKHLKKGLEQCLFYVLGHILMLLFYDWKYTKTKWFRGKFGGLCSEGWKWVVLSIKAKMLFHKPNSRYPIGWDCNVVFPENIIFHPESLNIFQAHGAYYQANARITIGEDVFIGPNVGIITSNHDLNNLIDHMPGKEVSIGNHSWIGMNSIILPGVNLGERTVVGAGSVVTKSFEKGHCIIGGNPAHIIRLL